MQTDSEFVPVENLKRMLKFWWLVLLLSIAGGIFGFIIHRQKPPLYEAKVVFMASIDFNKLPPPPYTLTQYDEDITLVLVEVAIRQSLPTVSGYVLDNHLMTDPDLVHDQSSIERQNAYWELRFRYSDPVVAQNVTNYWAQQAFTLLQDWQKSGQMPAYLFFDLVQLATLPSRPVYFETNKMVLAGGLVGLMAGVLIVNFPFLNRKKKG
jgi:uncharacterized protein involved in exopolysaccharide biosynthesis